MTNVRPERPPLRYYGGKWRLAPWIIEHFPPHSVYVETHGGSAAVLLQKTRAPLEVYNDLDQDVVRFFRCLRARPDELVRAVSLTPYAKAEFQLSRQPAEDDLEAARRYCVRSWQCRGGPSSGIPGFRRNVRWLTGSGAPAALSWRGVPTALEATAERLLGVQIEQASAIEIIQRYDQPDALHFVDPPYLPETRSRQQRTVGYVHEMTEDDHRSLAALLQDARGMVVVCGYPSELYSQLFKGWPMKRMETRTQGTRLGQEVLWLSPRTAQSLAQVPLPLEYRRREGDSSDSQTASKPDGPPRGPVPAGVR